MDKSEVLDTAKELVCGQRADDYGDAKENFDRIARLWAPLLGVDEVTPQQVALCLAALKMARLVTSPNHEDSWVDLAGYAALGGDVALDTVRLPGSAEPNPVDEVLRTMKSMGRDERSYTV
ncbi:hypothetical protein BH789_gp111 [Gordonia phage GMA6]|uniref:DUF6378 domain-containing protein n=1 Tax=Gordonia phage GMA6 TaxID=1647285 RepID=A0A0K0NLG7_9CAUD|nr:hypothetical protein BH789_gp111 [Gordonia phage GMA6]AKL88392.1 hypothetical protein GMA6_111 [Gordonia phage GMA6]